MTDWSQNGDPTARKPVVVKVSVKIGFDRIKRILGRIFGGGK